MSVHDAGSGIIELRGACTLEDAESLQQQLLGDPNRVVDWRNCETAHTAVIQVLLVAKPRLIGPPIGRFLRERLTVLFDTSTS